MIADRFIITLITIMPMIFINFNYIFVKTQGVDLIPIFNIYYNYKI